ncbi:SagB/ThcOx family dehydrogenase [Elusimicrobiota bacterium]
MKKEFPPLKRSPAIVGYWEDKNFIIEEYVSHQKLKASSDVIYLLSLFDTETAIDPREILYSKITEFKGESFENTIEEFIKLGFLIPDDKQTEDKYKKLKDWHWGEPARHYFFSTKDCYGALANESKEEYVKSVILTSPQPPLRKSYPGCKLVPLSKPAKLPGNFHETLLERRSVRSYSSKPIGMETLASLLFYTWGEQGKLKSKFFGNLLCKTSASGGARQPIEGYLLAFNIEGLPAGAYHYNTEKHALEEIALGDFREMAATNCADQVWVKDAAACFIMTAVIERTSWKYRHPRGLRGIFLDAGHVSQTLYLVAQSLSLGSCFILALLEEPFEKLLHLDGISESVVGVTTVGMPSSEYST